MMSSSWLSCQIENENAQIASKKFASMLEKVFEYYNELLKNYVQLLKICNDAKINVSFNLNESGQCYKEDDVVSSPKFTQNREQFDLPTSVFSMNAQMPRIVPEDNVKELSSLSRKYDSDDSFLNQSNYGKDEKENNELLKSPVLLKKRLKMRKSNIMPSRKILDNSFKKNVRALERNNVSIEINNCSQVKSGVAYAPTPKKKYSLSPHKNDSYEIVKCTPATRTSKKLSVSKLHNVDTTLLANGKKLKQCKLVLLPIEYDKSITFNNSQPLKQHESPISKKNIKKTEEELYQSKQIDEEIIEGSPKCSNSRLKIKERLKFKRKSPRRPTKKFCPNEDDKCTKGAKLSVPDLSCVMYADAKDSSPSQYSLDKSTSIQKSNLISRSRILKTSSQGESIGGSIDTSNFLQSPELAKLGLPYFKNFEATSQVEQMEKAEVMEHIPQIKKKNISKSLATFSACNDETFFSLVENPKEKENFDLRDSYFEENMNLDIPSQHVKRKLLTSFDIIPEKEEKDTGRHKTKSERSKMTGITCWQCKQYYENLGLSEEEMKRRLNECSRHRTVRVERPRTPEGYWDPLFPDTASSTCEND